MREFLYFIKIIFWVLFNDVVDLSKATGRAIKEGSIRFAKFMAPRCRKAAEKTKAFLIMCKKYAIIAGKKLAVLTKAGLKKLKAGTCFAARKIVSFTKKTAIKTWTWTKENVPVFFFNVGHIIRRGACAALLYITAKREKPVPRPELYRGEEIVPEEPSEEAVSDTDNEPEETAPAEALSEEEPEPSETTSIDEEQPSETISEEEEPAPSETINMEEEQEGVSEEISQAAEANDIEIEDKKPFVFSIPKFKVITDNFLKSSKDKISALSHKPKTEEKSDEPETAEKVFTTPSEDVSEITDETQEVEDVKEAVEEVPLSDISEPTEEEPLSEAFASEQEEEPLTETDASEPSDADVTEETVSESTEPVKDEEPPAAIEEPAEEPPAEVTEPSGEEEITETATETVEPELSVEIEESQSEETKETPAEATEEPSAEAASKETAESTTETSELVEETETEQPPAEIEEPQTEELPEPTEEPVEEPVIPADFTPPEPEDFQYGETFDKEDVIPEGISLPEPEDFEYDEQSEEQVSEETPVEPEEEPVVSKPAEEAEEIEDVATEPVETPVEDTPKKDVPSKKKRKYPKQKARLLLIIPSWIICAAASIIPFVMADSITSEIDLNRGYLPIHGTRTTAMLLIMLGMMFSVLLLGETLAAVFRLIKRHTVGRKSMFSSTGVCFFLTYLVAMCFFVREELSGTLAETFIAPIAPALSKALPIIAIILFLVASVKFMVTVNKYFDED